MNQEFAILPWEYRGADFDPTPHARTSLEIEGKQRDFLLKMRDGIIYFKDPNRAPIFATLRRFENQLHGDELVQAWRTEMERENFGRHRARTLDFHEAPGNTVIVAIIRSDFSGWISDALHLDWHEIPRHRDGKTLNIWNDSLKSAIWRAMLKVRDSLRDRPMPASERQSIRTHYLSGNEAELRRVFAVVMQLYVRRSGPDSSRTWEFKATNIASSGGFWGFGPVFNPDLRFSPTLPSLLRLLEQHFVWLSQGWKHHDTKSIHPPQWGEDWRGSYSITIPTIKITVPLVASLSHHERLELLLELRDWLDGKVSPRQSANWLAQALD